MSFIEERAVEWSSATVRRFVNPSEFDLFPASTATFKALSSEDIDSIFSTAKVCYFSAARSVEMRSNLVVCFESKEAS